MFKFVAVYIGFLFASISLMAQPDTTGTTSSNDSTTREFASTDPIELATNPEYVPTSGPLLPPSALKNKRVYTSVAAASQQPDSVYRLNLANQGLKDIPQPVLRMVNLQELILDGNKIKTIPAGIGNLANLQTLSLGNNKIKVLPQEMQNLLNLERFTLPKNRIMELPVWVGGLGKLRFLDLRFNPMVSYEIRLVQSNLTRCQIIY